jgi:undecaprenyl-diphosphatase
MSRQNYRAGFWQGVRYTCGGAARRRQAIESRLADIWKETFLRTMTGDVFHLNYMQAILLGLLQGLTEFLPVSSTAHMAVASRLLFGQDAGAAFSAVVQLGPIVAIIAYFRADLIRYVQGIVRTKSPLKIGAEDLDARLGWYTLLGTIPLAIFGVLLEHKIDTVFRKPSVMGVSLIVLAVILFVAERVGKRNKTLEQMTLRESQVIGWAQALALVPGASRSGVTITAGLFQGLDRESAARFSFLLSIPAITAAGLYKLLKEVKGTGLGPDIGPYLLGALVAGLFAYVVVRWFLGYMKEHDTMGFIIYRIVLGVALLGLVATHKISDAPPKKEAPKPITASVGLVRHA